MKAYYLQIPGRVHAMNEDAYASSIFKDQPGAVWGLFMVADGLTDFTGIFASHIAVKNIHYQVRDAVQSGHKDYETILNEAICQAHQKLEQRGSTRTTLSLVLLSDEQLYLAHLGDSKIRLIYNDSVKIITPDENRGGVPTNYLGAAYLDGKSIAERINFIRPYEQGLGKPNAIQLETDGLTSRATEQEIMDILRAKYADPSDILRDYQQLIFQPQEKLAELPQRMLEAIVQSSAGEDVSDHQIIKKVRNKSNYLPRIKELYSHRTDKALSERLDEVLKFDDTTVIYVDLQDTVEHSLHQLASLSERLPQVEQLLTEERRTHEKIMQEQAGLNEELTDKNAAIIDKLALVEQDKVVVQGAVEAWTKKYHDIEQRNIELQEELNKKNLTQQSISTRWNELYNRGKQATFKLLQELTEDGDKPK